MPRKPLHPRAKDCLDFIKDFIRINQYPPTIREIMAAMGQNSPNSAVGHIRYLEKNGWITRDKKKARSIRITTP